MLMWIYHVIQEELSLQAENPTCGPKFSQAACISVDSKSNETILEVEKVVCHPELQRHIEKAACSLDVSRQAKKAKWGIYDTSGKSVEQLVKRSLFLRPACILHSQAG